MAYTEDSDTVAQELADKLRDMARRKEDVLDAVIAALPAKLPVDKAKPWDTDLKRWADQHNRLIDRITDIFEKAKES